MSSDHKKLRKRDLLLYAGVLVAAFLLVFGISKGVEKLSAKSARRDNVTQPQVTTRAPVTAVPETTTEVTTETAVTTTEPASETAPEAVTEAAAETETATTTDAPAAASETEKTTKKTEKTEDKKTEATTAATEPRGLVMPEDTGKPADAMTKEEVFESIDAGYSTTGYNNNIKNILLIGVDKKELKENPIFRMAGQSDVIMILSMNLKAKEYFLVSINRDLQVPVENFSNIGDSYGYVLEQIELAYGYGDGSRISGNCVVNSVNFLLNNRVPLLGFIAAPTTIISTLADAVDGVPVKIEDDFTGVDDTLVQGETVVLRGQHAETFVRARMTMKYNPLNEYRMTRQFAFCESFINKAKSTMNAKQLVSMYNDVTDMLMTNMGSSDITKWIATLYDYTFRGFYRIDGEYGPDQHGAWSMIPDEEEIMALVDDLYYKK